MARDEDEFVTVAEIAERFKVSQQTVRNWIDRGELVAYRLGSRRVRVRRSDLDLFIESGGTPARPRRFSVLEYKEHEGQPVYERAVGPFSSRSKAEKWSADAPQDVLERVIVPLETP